MPFPRILHWALIAPFALFFAMYLAAFSGAQVFNDPVMKVVGMAIIGGGGLTELVAVPIAIFLLLRGGPYVTWGNALATALGAVPLVVLGVVLFVLRFGHFHI